MFFRQLGQTGQAFPTIDGTGGIVGVDDDDGARIRRDQVPDGIDLGREPVFLVTRVVHSRTAIQYGCGGPQRIVRTGDQHLIPRVEQGPQREIDEFTNTVADEHLLGRRIHYASTLLAHDHGFPGGEDALLPAIRFAGSQVLDHGEAHGFRRAKSKDSRITDIQGKYFVPLSLQFHGSSSKAAANFVTNGLERPAGLYLGGMQHG